MSPRSKIANQQIRDERHEQILSAALKVFARRGLVATKISDIASAAGLSHGLIYHYFKTKDEIFTELVKRAYESTLGIFKYASQLDISPLEKIRTITEMIISGAYQGEGVYFWNIVSQAHMSEAVPEKVKKMVTDNKSLRNDIFVEIIIEGQKLGQFTQGDPLELTAAYYSMLNGMAVIQMRVINDDRSILLPNVDIIMRLLINPENKDQVSISQVIKCQFKPVQLIDKRLVYRSRKGPAAEFTNLKSTAIETIKNGSKVYRIELEDNACEKRIALVKAENLQPVYIELHDLKENAISKIEYNNDIVTFNSPARKLYQKVKLRGEYYDNYTLFFILRGFPFESNKKIKFTLVLDGTQNRPVGPWDMEVQMIAVETVQVPAGEFNCYKLEMGIGGLDMSYITANKFYFWYTIDEPRFLVKYEDTRGNLRELVKFE